MKRIKYLKTKLLYTLGYLACIAVFYSFSVPCVFQTLFSIPCPGCGMTRALRAALQLDFASAFAYHKMFWAVPVGYLYFLFDGRLFNNRRVDKIILISIGAGFIVDWLIKLCNVV